MASYFRPVPIDSKLSPMLTLPQMQRKARSKSKYTQYAPSAVDISTGIFQRDGYRTPQTKVYVNKYKYICMEEEGGGPDKSCLLGGRI